jgi:hypothetical protein
MILRGVDPAELTPCGPRVEVYEPASGTAHREESVRTRPVFEILPDGNRFSHLVSAEAALGCLEPQGPSLRGGGRGTHLPIDF